MANALRPSKGLITFTVMLVTILEVLDMTIVNVALPPMMGSLGANNEEITWVLTSYIVAAAIFMPLTGLLIELLGQKTLLIVNIIGFCLASILCGVSQSLPEMVLFRTMQGVFGASLVPLSQFILGNTYGSNEQAKAMAMWGMGVMVAPVLGPTLGGYITETFNWRWIFYINLPVCVLTLVLSIFCIKQTPKTSKKIDYLGLLLMTLSIGAFQLFLDQGNSKDWLQSNLICALLITTVLSSLCFIARGLKTQHHIISLSLFKNRNFLVCSVLIFGYMISLFGVLSIQPMMLENLMGYPTAQAGLLMAPRALASALTMAVVAKMANRVHPHKLILAGLILSFISSHTLTSFQLQTPAETMIWVGLIQGIGMGLFFVPTSTLALSTLSREQTAEASGLFSLSRSIGGSIGISLISTIASRQTQINYHSLSKYISDTNASLEQFLAKQQLDIHMPMVTKLMSNKVLLQSNFTAFIDGFLLSSYGFLLLIPLLLVLEAHPRGTAAAAVH